MLLGISRHTAICLYIVLCIYAARRWRVSTWGRCRSKRSMGGKTVIITGASNSLGKATALELARRGARVILACRKIGKGMEAAIDIRRRTGSQGVVVSHLDLASFPSIRAFVNSMLKRETHIDALVNNEVVSPCHYSTTENGLELQMGVNHLGHFLLTNLLLERIKTSSPSRIVVVTSNSYKTGSPKLPELVLSRADYDKRRAAADSMLASVLFVRELSQRLKGTGVHVYAACPGLVYTGITNYANLPWYLVLLLLPFWLFALRTPEQACQTIVDCVVNEEYEQQNGKFYRNCKAERWHSTALDEDLAFKVWHASEQLTGLLLPEGGRGSVAF